MWLSVDPLFEKYAGMSPYNYCAGNPVKLVDPDGRDLVHTDNKQSDSYYKNSLILPNTPFKEDNAVHVVTHGSKDALLLEDVMVKSIETIVNYLDKSNSKVWKERKGGSEPTIVVLHCCNTAKGENNIASSLSEETKGMIVVALNEGLSLRLYNDTSAGENVINEGKWIIYQNGKEIGSLPGNTMPTSDIIKKEINHGIE